MPDIPRRIRLEWKRLKEKPAPRVVIQKHGIKQPADFASTVPARSSSRICRDDIESLSLPVLWRRSLLLWRHAGYLFKWCAASSIRYPANIVLY